MKLFVETHGCRANHYDSEAVLELARRGGYEIVDDVTGADVAIVNTCAVTAEAERDARRAVRRVARRNQGIRTVVMGCSAALPASGSVLRALPTVSSVVAGAEMASVAAALGVTLTAGTVRQQTVRAQLRVQDGCDEHCTFCATTLARGASRSRTPDAVVAEALALAEHHPEIVITGTHIGTYGLDIGSSLGVLMQHLVRQVPDVRFRLSSVEATEVDDALVDLMATEPRRLAPHLHAPLQSGSDTVLRRMGRHWYSASTYARAVERIAARVKVLGLGADVIVGFPGESNADFEATERLIRDLPFTYLHVFSYSPRAGTAAPRLGAPVAHESAAVRSQRLRDLASEKAGDHARRRNGTQADAIVIRGSGDAQVMTEDYLTLSLAEPRPRGDRVSVALAMLGDALMAHPAR